MEAAAAWIKEIYQQQKQRHELKKLSRRVAEFLKKSQLSRRRWLIIMIVDYNNDTNLSDIQTVDKSKTIAAEKY